MIDVKGLCPAHILCILYANTRGRVNTGELSLAAALEFILGRHWLLVKAGQLPTTFRWDYVYGRPIKVEIDSDGNLHFEHLYDRDAPGGPGTCARLIEVLRRLPCAQDMSEALRQWEVNDEMRGIAQCWN